MKVKYDTHSFKFNTHGSRDIYISRSIQNHGIWEKELTEIWYNHIKEGDVVLDIGANIGWYTKIANLKGATAISIEPDPKSFNLLQQNCSGSGNEFHQLCVGNSTDDVMLKLSDDNYGDNQTGVSGDIVCRQTTVDNLVGNIANKIRAIKIDTQGWEPNILLGAVETLNRVVDDCLIIIEYWPFGLNQAGFDSTSYQPLFDAFKGTPAYYPQYLDWDSNVDKLPVYADIVMYKNNSLSEDIDGR